MFIWIVNGLWVNNPCQREKKKFTSKTGTQKFVCAVFVLRQCVHSIRVTKNKRRAFEYENGRTLLLKMTFLCRWLFKRLASSTSVRKTCKLAVTRLSSLEHIFWCTVIFGLVSFILSCKRIKSVNRFKRDYWIPSFGMPHAPCSMLIVSFQLQAASTVGFQFRDFEFESENGCLACGWPNTETMF